MTAREVKCACDFLAIASRYDVQLQRVGNQFRARCPFHSERHPSFYLHPEQKVFHCFGCGRGGDVFTFVILAESCTFPRALEIVAESSSGVARSGSPQSGERFGVREEGGQALLARAAGEPHSPHSRTAILARLDETERVLAAIRRTNDADYLRLATACEPAREAHLLETEG